MKIEDLNLFYYPQNKNVIFHISDNTTKVIILKLHQINNFSGRKKVMENGELYLRIPNNIIKNYLILVLEYV